MSDRRSPRSARRAVVHWALRLLRREWRQHVLVVTLLTVAVAGALFGATAAYNVTPGSTSWRDGAFGRATHLFDVNVDDHEQLDGFVGDARSWFGDVDVITHRDVTVPGSTEVLEVRGQDPAGRLGAPTLAVLDGRYPAASDQVALTDGAAALLDASIGDPVELDGLRASVVGIVENPEDLDQEFALLPASADGTPNAATILVHADDERIVSFRPQAPPTSWVTAERGRSEKTVAAVGVLIVGAVAMSLVTLVAAAAFVVIAQRRQRQLGLLAAAGATSRQVRLVMIADGAAVGLAAAAAGALIAFAGWIAAVPALENAAGRRLDRLDIPWWVFLVGAVLCVASAVAAAWWPARTVGRLPIMSALSGRPPRPRRARRSAVAALILLTGGIVCLAFAIDPSSDSGSAPLAIAGVVGTTLGLVLIAPPAIRLLSPLGRRAPLAVRIAVRDLARYQSRSGAALAAVSLGLAIAVSVVVVAAANEDADAAGNLSDRQLLVHVGDWGGGTPLYLPELEATDNRAVRDSVEAWAATLPDATIVPLEAAIDPTVSERNAGRVHHPTVVLGKPVDENTYADSGLVYVATPALLAYLSIDPARIEASTILLTTQPGEVHLTGNVTYSNTSSIASSSVQRIEVPRYSSLPHALITARGLDYGAWTPAPAGWLIESPSRITDEQLAAAREMAAVAGLSVESRDTQAALSTIRSAATGIGIAVALAILAMTVGLIRAEAAGDVRTLTAVGASSRTRRRVTAATAATLAVLAVLLGMAVAYAAVVAGYTPAIDRLGNVPFTELLTIAVGFPLIAAAAGWALAGRQPRLIARQLTE